MLSIFGYMCDSSDKKSKLTLRGLSTSSRKQESVIGCVPLTEGQEHLKANCDIALFSTPRTQCGAQPALYFTHECSGGAFQRIHTRYSWTVYAMGTFNI
jgi:hypothetical protein